MRPRIFIWCFFFFCLCVGKSYGQTNFCPPNIDFETATFSNWYLYTGTCCPISTPTLSGAVANRHTLTTGATVDPYGGFPVVAPEGGVYSLKLGNNGTGSQAERARYYVNVPSGPSKYILLYRYAVVLQDPNHTAVQQPRFEVKAYDSATNTPITCNQHIYVASSSLPGFTQSTTTSGVYYKPWTTASLDLTAYKGKTVAIDFASGDCSLGGHFGYGYVDLNCGLFQISAVNCNNTNTITLSGPPGYKHYQWMDSALTTIIDTQRTITIPSPLTPTKFAVILTPYTGFGCPDTLYTEYLIIPDTITAVTSNDTTICNGKAAQISINTTYSKGTLTYKWWPSAGLSCTTCKNPVASPADTATYYAYIENSFGCRDTDDITIAVRPPINVNAGNDTAVCQADTALLNGSGTGGNSFLWLPSANVVNSANAVTKTWVTATTTYSLILSDAYGCHDTDKVLVTAKAVPVANAGNDTTVCPATAINLSGSGGGVYRWLPVAKVSDSAIANPQVVVNGNTTYYLTVTHASTGCIDKDTVTVFEAPLPVANAGNDTTVCAEAVIQLHGNGGQYYYWTPDTPNMTGSQLATPTVYLPYQAAPKLYRLVVLNSFFCTDTDYVAVTVRPKPVANAGNDTSVCEHTFIQLKGSGGTTYSWAPVSGLTNATTPNPGYLVNTAANFTLIVANSFNCRDTDDVNIGVYPLPVANAGNDTAVCFHRTIQLNGSGGGSYKWTPVSNISAPTQANPVLFGDSSRKYTLYVTSVNGCKDTDEIYVTVNPVPVAGAGNDTGTCAGQLITLQGSGDGTYSWTPVAGLDNPSAANPVATVDKTGSYILTVTNSFGCTDTASVRLAAFPYPKAGAGEDSVVCPGAHIQLNGSGGSKYTWYPAGGLSDAHIKAPVATIYEPVDYYVSVANEYGCSDTDEVSFSIIPYHFGIGNDTAICRGDTALLYASGGHYLWLSDNAISANTIAQPLVWPHDNYDYKVTITDTVCNREETYKITVTVIPLPELKIVTTPKDCGLETGSLTATGAQKYSWWPRDFLSDPDAAATKAFPRVSTLYTLTGISEAGCVDTASAWLHVYQDDGRIFAPDAFTPNGDGINDCYHVVVPDDMTDFELLINNRWGQVMFHSTDPAGCWDGRFNGEDAPIDTYVYFYKGHSKLCGEIFRKNNLELIR